MKEEPRLRRQHRNLSHQWPLDTQPWLTHPHFQMTRSRPPLLTLWRDNGWERWSCCCAAAIRTTLEWRGRTSNYFCAEKNASSTAVATAGFSPWYMSHSLLLAKNEMVPQWEVDDGQISSFARDDARFIFQKTWSNNVIHDEWVWAFENSSFSPTKKKEIKCKASFSTPVLKRDPTWYIWTMVHQNTYRKKCDT